MKKALIIIGIALGVILVALVAAGFYIVNANLAMEHRGHDIGVVQRDERVLSGIDSMA